MLYSEFSIDHMTKKFHGVLYQKKKNQDCSHYNLNSCMELQIIQVNSIPSSHQSINPHDLKSKASNTKSVDIFSFACCFLLLYPYLYITKTLRKEKLKE